MKIKVTARLDAVVQADVYTFFRQIYKMWVECGLYPELNIEDVKDEVFDMAQPEDPLHITPQDLQVTHTHAVYIRFSRDRPVVQGITQWSASIDLQILLRLKPYPMRDHRLLGTHMQHQYAHQRLLHTLHNQAET